MRDFKNRYWPALLTVVWWILIFAVDPTHTLRSDHWLIGALVIGLNLAGGPTKRILIYLAPFVLTGVVYDSQRYWGDFVRGRIRIEEPYNFDKFFFGIQTASGVLTPNEWFQLHTHWLLDLYTGFFYLTFIFIYMAMNAWYNFGLERFRKNFNSTAAMQMGWAFFWVNVIGYSTYYWYPAAPPWYVAIYGLGPVNMTALPNPAGCVRFDQLLGTNFFGEMYGRSADVFGAIPSLHIAYPLQAIFFAFRFNSLKIFSIVFYLTMCFSAVYLNHHYILDILWGSAYAIGVLWAMGFFKKVKS